ncbi:MAG TPA: M20/M25/M40 family metallo-hydrolase, partial [Pyrinomonadaceae bacterium]|nr:M20/M25/M40 family metallo-hydrolase [Pyrinomonadaceae bacterium]
MVQAAVPKSVTTPERLSRFGSLSSFILLLVLVVLVLLTVYAMSPPESVSVQAPATEFSSGRAMQYLKAISVSTHPVGSADHERVGEYIVHELASMGLNPEIQQTSVVQQVETGFVRGANVRNIVARLKGTESGRALMLTSHYDSKQGSFGASDDGAAVAAMLESARALKAGSPLKNDVILLFTDGEELGLLGAKAFVDEHPWAKEVGLVLNFEARGTSGPAVMFETSNGNQGLIDGLAHAAPHPVANSLMYDIYRLLPNDTDLTVFKESGLPGMNFAFINEPSRYHTPLDNTNNLDERSLQHQGSYILGLTRYFGDRNLDGRSARNAVYFDLFGLTLVHYSAVWILPLTVLVVLSFVAVAWYGLRKRIVTLPAAIRGFLVFLLSLVVSPGLVALVWWLIRSFRRDYAVMARGNIYHGEFYFLGFAALSIAVFSVFCILFSKKLGVYNLALGSLFGGLILLLASSFFLPGASYLLAWPMLGSLVTLALIFKTAGEESHSTKRLAVLA